MTATTILHGKRAETVSGGGGTRERAHNADLKPITRTAAVSLRKKRARGGEVCTRLF
jgi:hypothetical protein